MCESTFRAAKPMAGPFSSVINFTINEFLQRVQKLAVLQTIKCSSDFNKNNLTFPKHHKQSRQTCSIFSTSATTVITEKLLEETVSRAYLQASQILSVCGFSILDPNDKMISFEDVNRLAHEKLARSKCRSSNKKDNKSDNAEQEE
jgi:hypothetical protein